MSYPQQPTPPGYGYAPDHPRATTSLVLGIVALVLCQILGPVAWIVGGNAVKEIDASNGALGGRGSANAGKILGIIATVFLVLAVIGLILLVVLGLAISTSSSTSTG
jgi:Domain of unknown function (DUF4190)